MSKLKPMQIIFIFLTLILLAVAVFFLGGKTKKSLVEFPSHNLKIEVELAQTIVQQAKGLMYRESLAENAGMLFIFSGENPKTFWMKNTKIPLDLIFISADKKVAEIKENFEPCREASCPAYQSQAAVKYVLEVNAGFVSKNNIQINDALNF
jgi:hypothetical protein